ncbi:MAG: hypothetical protein AMXMBFR64_04310 [Myxococcales bacterium]
MGLVSRLWPCRTRTQARARFRGGRLGSARRFGGQWSSAPATRRLRGKEGAACVRCLGARADVASVAHVTMPRVLAVPAQEQALPASLYVHRDTQGMGDSMSADALGVARSLPCMVRAPRESVYSRGRLRGTSTADGLARRSMGRLSRGVEMSWSRQDGGGFLNTGG